MVQQPLLNAFQHQQTAVTSATTESGQENDGYEALNTTNALANNYYLPNSSENSTMQADLSGETLNINILALAATAASMERPMAPQQILPQLSSPTFQNPPIQEIRFNNGRNTSPLTLSTQNNSSTAENSCVSATVSATNAPYQAASDGAYLSVPETIGLKNINCIDEDAHDLGYDSDGEIGPFFDAVAGEEQFEDYDEEVVGVMESIPPLQAQEDASTPPQLSEVAIRGMKVAELRSELKNRKQTVSGTKEVLVQRLISCMHLPPSTDVATGNVSNDIQPTVDFHHGVRWRLLDPDPTPYNFQKLVALHLINPERYPLDRRQHLKRKSEEADVRSLRNGSVTSSSNSLSKRAATINDKALDPDQGDLRIRLSTKYFHCPVRPKVKDPSCQLHRWASSDPTHKNRGGILCCDCCNVNLCIECFDLYHKINNVQRLRSEVRKIIRNKEGH
jgi:hypothetical protein